MIAVSAVVMFGLMDLNTGQFDHALFSKTWTWMALCMGSAMSITVLRCIKVKAALFARAALVFAASLWLVRSQARVSESPG